MTHAEQIATIQRNHREDLQLIFGEIKSVNRSVTQIETEMGHMVKRESVIPLIVDETKKIFALHTVECDNKRNSKPERQKHDWFKTIRNAVYLAAIVGGGGGAILNWMS